MTSVQYIPPRLDAIRFVPESVICCFQFQEKKPLKGIAGLIDWRMLGCVSRLRIADTWEAGFGERLLVMPGNRLPASYIVLFGCGREADFTETVYTELLTQMIGCAREMRASRIVLSPPGRSEDLISGEAAIRLFFQNCPAIMCNESEFSFTIMDSLEIQSIIESESERHRLRTDLTPLNTGRTFTS
ncbi:MAG: hypothetical protein JXX14_13990 [Deltaproteobacteria bacterium]|nr:hypothetical protein [Deltaproteobacteria bacterium]